jgi:predicted transcriptional regulator
MLKISLKNVMTQGYLYVENHEGMGKALAVLRDRRISCLFVLKDDMPVGIITERKIMKRAIAGMDLLSASVKEVMSGPLLSLHPSNTVGEACEFMTKYEIRHVGIVDENGRLKGTVTPGNIVNLLSSDSFSSSALVGDVMSSSIALEKPESHLKQAGIAMLEKRSCCTIVMDGDKPFGIVSEKDAARALSFGQEISTIRLEKIMSKPVITVKERDTVAQGIITLREHCIHRAVVIGSQDKVVGIFALNNLVQNIDKVLNKRLESRSF